MSNDRQMKINSNIKKSFTVSVKYKIYSSKTFVVTNSQKFKRDVDEST